MPSLKSSSKTGDTISLFATERRAMVTAMQTSKWVAGHTKHTELLEASKAAEEAITHMLEFLPATAATDKPTK